MPAFFITFYIIIIYRNFIILYLIKICASIHLDVDRVTPSNARTAKLTYASNATGLLRQETHQPQEIQLNVVIAIRILDDAFMTLLNKYAHI